MDGRTVVIGSPACWQVEFAALAAERQGAPAVAVSRRQTFNLCLRIRTCHAGFSPLGDVPRLNGTARSGLPLTFCMQVRGRSTAVLAARRRPLGPLVAASSVAAVHRVCAGVGCCAAGVAGDELRLVANLRTHAQTFRARYGHAPPVAVLAQLLADDAQRASLTGETRPLGATTLLVGGDYGGRRGSAAAVVYRVEPTGQFYRCRAAAGGRACEDASAWLAAHLPEADAEVDANAAEVDAAEADDAEAATLVQTALQSLLQATPRQPESDSLGERSSSSSGGACVDDFQVGVSSAAAGFRFLTTAELAAALKAAEAANGSECAPPT